MNLLILGCGACTESPVYRGTDRSVPHYVTGLSDDHPANKAFLWYIAEGGEDGIVHDLAKAQELVEAYRNLQPPQYFEVVEITVRNQPPITHSQLLGFDLSTGYESLLTTGLEIVKKPPEGTLVNDPLLIIWPLLKLIKQYFQTKLNANGLFNDYTTAQFCLDCMLALQTIRPNLWENEQVKFEVYGLWEVLD